MRAIVKTQRARRADPQLAARAAQRLFPAEEASLIAFEVARDVPFYDTTITEEMVAHAARFAREMGTLEGEARYGELVATQFAATLWGRAECGGRTRWRTGSSTSESNRASRRCRTVVALT